jgi:hypothetical protein
VPPALMLQLRPRGFGQKLSEAVQRKMESIFGADFSDVRVNVGPEASSIGALAFTYGSNLYFAHGQYNPSSPHGQRLLGHELAHVVQQRAGRARNPFGFGVAVVQDPGLEAEAERMALRTVVMPAQPPSPVPPRSLQAAPALTRFPPPPPRPAPPVGGKRTNVLQPANEPWIRSGNGIYGRQRPLTFSEAMGTTGGSQTTILGAKLNGNFFGKFQNAAEHMGKAKRQDLLDHKYPQTLCTICPDSEKPHAEDYLLTALETEWIAEKDWFSHYPSVEKNGQKVQKKAVLSIRINRAPCPRCARNLESYCQARNLAMRIKASLYHSAEDDEKRTGTKYLDSKNYPVRQWDVDRMLEKNLKDKPENLKKWETKQLGKKSNPYHMTGRSKLEQEQSLLFNNARINYNIPMKTGWKAHNADLTRANLNN